MLLIIFLIQSTFALNCANFYDYSNGNVVCVDQCPYNTINFNNVCCSSNQFYNNNVCSYCFGWVTNNGTNCCNYGEYYSNISRKCINCNLETYLNGKLCCDGCSYVDMNLQPPRCIKVGTGSCPNIKCTSQQRICCSAQTYFFLPSKQCLNRNFNMKCDQTRKICCNSNQFLQYVNNQLTCVNQCKFGININGIQCISRKCSTYNNTIFSINDGKGTLLGFANNQCCYALGLNNMCTFKNQNCITRFISANFSICCPQDQFYDFSTNKCIIICNGIASLRLFCLPINTYLDLSILPPKITNRSIPCNNLILPTLLSICCPQNMYLNGTYGCIYCRGKIFGLDNNQKCCLNDQVYDTHQKVCKKCRGIIDNTGTICCNYSSYFSYDSKGNVFCQQSCPLQMIQNYVYCCSICNNQCSSPLLSCVIPSLCSPSYFNKNSCNSCACGNCITTTTLCVSCNSNSSNCAQLCSSGKVFDASSQQCLNCDMSCLQCLAPLDSSQCTICNIGYIYYSGFCMICSINCLTCISEPNYCTSCFQDSNFPILYNGKCVQDCGIGYYLTSYLDCDVCNPICLTCYNSDAKSCLTCIDNYYLYPGNCLKCISPCKSCLSNIICLLCNDGFKLLKSNSSCVNICPQNTLQLLYLNSSSCWACHPLCINCSIIPINCNLCMNSYYLTNSSGFSTCIKCPIGCKSCSSSSNCLGDCLPGYFSQNNMMCLPCDITCITCNGGSNNNCLSCSTGVTLSNNMCIGCASTCLTCSNPTFCLTCNNQLLLFQGQCLTSCPNNTYLNYNYCVSCDITCSSCLQNNICLTCSPKFPYFDNNKCVAQCNSTSFINKNECTLCNGTVFSIGTACCPHGYIVIQQKCRERKVIINNTIIPKQNNSSNNTSEQTNNSISNSSINNTVSQTNILFNSFFYTDTLNLYITIYCSNIRINYTLLSLRLIQQKNRRMLDSNISLNYQILQNNKNYIKISLPITANFSNYPLLQISYQNYSMYTSKPYVQIMQSNYDASSYSYLSYFGYILSCILIIFIMLTKYKSHFEAEETNRFIIHVFNFVQIIGMFQFYTSNDKMLYSLYKGFQYSHVDFIPNIFLSLLPNDYIEGNIPNSFIPDANIIRNCGSIFTFQLFLLILFIVAIILSFGLFWIYKLDEPPMIRKIFRIFVGIFSIGFLKQTYFATITILYRSNNIKYPHISQNCFYFSIGLLVFLLCVISAFFYHNYFTYLSDKQQHLYTLRELSQHLQSYLQGIILAFCINKTPIFIFIGLEIAWFIFNIFLYQYTQDVWRIKFYVSGLLITLGEIFLCFGTKISLVTLIITMICIGILIIYCFYQVIGLYYWDFMKLFGISQPQPPQPQVEIKQEQEIQNAEAPVSEF